MMAFTFNCRNTRRARPSLLRMLTWLSGMRMVRPCSDKAWRICWRIHQTAYEMNLNPRDGSNLSAAFMRPMFPSFTRSISSNPTVLVLLRYGDHKAQIRFDKPLERGVVTGLYAGSEIAFLIRGDHLNPAQITKIFLDGLGPGRHGGGYYQLSQFCYSY